MNKIAFITGIAGQDGSYLAELLLSKGYMVHGLVRRSSSITTWRLDGVYDNPNLRLHYGDMLDGGALTNLLEEVAPDEVYNLAAQSHVAVSFQIPEYTANVAGLGFLRLLEACVRLEKAPRIYQASTSEMYGSRLFQRTDDQATICTPFSPASPYAAAKLFAHELVNAYRNRLWIVRGIAFNHESPRRGETFVTRKIARAVARIKAGVQRELVLGNVTTYRDWGYAPEYVEAMWLSLQAQSDNDYIFATGESHSVGEFFAEAFSHAGLDPCAHVVTRDARYERPRDIHYLRGDPGRTRAELGWEAKTKFKDLVKIMVDAEMANY